MILFYFFAFAYEDHSAKSDKSISIGWLASTEKAGSPAHSLLKSI